MSTNALQDRPAAPLPLLDRGQLRKRWRYVALFAEELMLCAARAEIGPATQSFWVLWDRESTPATTTTSSSAPATATASAASPAPSAASSSPRASA